MTVLRIEVLGAGQTASASPHVEMLIDHFLRRPVA
jgi:hypothetical protein